MNHLTIFKSIPPLGATILFRIIHTFSIRFDGGTETSKQIKTIPNYMIKSTANTNKIL